MLIIKCDTMPDYIEKYDIKMKGLRLEKENPYEAIKIL